MALDRRASSTENASAVGAAGDQIGVRVAPGTTTLTRMPRGASSAASTRAIARTPALLAAYAEYAGAPRTACTEPFKMTDAPLWRCAAAACTVKNTDDRLVRRRRSNVCADVAPTGVVPPMPALANTMSSLPKRWIAAAIACSGEPGSVMSAWIANALAPSSRVAASRVLALRPVMATSAPSAMKRRAVARPMPLFPPVMKAIFPASRMSSPPDYDAW